jgi:NAD-dependent deacetylase sirtuin 1
MKPDIVFFGEGLPEAFHDAMAKDKDECDLLIVIGSSLKVRPVALIPSKLLLRNINCHWFINIYIIANLYFFLIGSLPSNVPQILINRERLPHLNFDIELLGDSDIVIDQLCHM